MATQTGRAAGAYLQVRDRATKRMNSARTKDLLFPIVRDRMVSAERRRRDHPMDNSSVYSRSQAVCAAGLNHAMLSCEQAPSGTVWLSGGCMNVSASWCHTVCRAIMFTLSLLVAATPGQVLGQAPELQPRDLAGCLEKLDMAYQETDRQTRLHDQSEAEITRLQQLSLIHI